MKYQIDTLHPDEQSTIQPRVLEASDRFVLPTIITYEIQNLHAFVSIGIIAPNSKAVNEY